jgi:GWxTD domain-containing protein
MNTTLSAGWANPENKGEYNFKNSTVFGVSWNFQLTEFGGLQFNYYHILSHYSERPDWPRASYDLDEISATLRMKATLQNRLNVFGIAGLGYFNHSLSGGDDHLGMVYGLGADYRLNDKIAVLIQFRRHNYNSDFKEVDSWNSILGGFTFYFHFEPGRISYSEKDKALIIYKFLATKKQRGKSETELKQRAQVFWQELDPEIREEYIARFDYVHDSFSSQRPGCKTDPGRIWLILGQPDDRIIIPPASAHTPHSYEIWEYWRGWKNAHPVIFIFKEKSAGELYQIECNVPGEFGYKGHNYQQIIDEYQFLYLIP